MGTPTWGAARPTPGAASIVARICAIRRCISAVRKSDGSTGSAGRRSTGSPHSTIGRMSPSLMATSEFHNQPAPGAARLENAVGLGGAPGRDGPSHSQRHLAGLRLLAQPVEFFLLAGIGADEHRMPGDTAYLISREPAPGHRTGWDAPPCGPRGPPIAIP